METLTVRIPTALRSFTEGSDELTVRAASVREALDSLGERHELLVQRVLTRGGDLRPYVNLFLDDSDIRLLEGLDTRVQAGQTLSIVPSVAGG